MNVPWPPKTPLEVSPKDINAIHQVAQGKGVVLLIRSFVGKKDDELDSEEFWKLTVEIPKVFPRRSYTIEATVANTRYSNTNSGSGLKSIALAPRSC